MAIVALNVTIFIDTDSDPEHVAITFESGASHALEGFPDGDVIQVDVESADTLGANEIAERGFDE